MSMSEFGHGCSYCHCFNQVTGIVGSSHIAINLYLNKIQQDFISMPDHIVKLFWTSQKHRNEAVGCKFDISETNMYVANISCFHTKQLPNVLWDQEKERWPPNRWSYVRSTGLSISGHQKSMKLNLKKIQSKMLVSCSTIMGLYPS